MQPSCEQRSGLNPAPPRLDAPADDRELMARAARGSAESFDTLFQCHRSGLFGFLYRRLRCHEEAEDAVGLTFIRAWRARATFRGDSSAKAWLYQIATRVAVDLLRRRQRHSAEQQLDPRESDLAELAREEPLDPTSVLLDAEREAETRLAINRALGRLTAEERRLLALFYFDGRSYQEISALLGISRSQVRGRLHRIRGRVHDDLVARQNWHPAWTGS